MAEKLRELDKAVAELLGYEVRNIDGVYILPAGQKGVFFPEELSYYSYDDGDAVLELITELRKRGFLASLEFNRQNCTAIFYKPKGDAFTSTTKRIHESVTRAAYHALAGKEWRE